MMRLEPKPAAALSAASFTLLLIFGAAWPGPGLWLLAAGLIFFAAAACAWWLDAAPAQRGGAAQRSTQRMAHSPFAATMHRPGGVAVGGMSGGGAAGALLPSRAADGRWQMPERVHLSLVMAAIGLLALILFIGGALGGGGDEAVTAVELETNPTVIDRSREGDPSALPAPAAPGGAVPAAQDAATSATPAAAGGVTAAATAPNAATTPSAAPAAQPRPIVVADPKPATPVEVQAREQAAAVAAPARTVEHVVADGDTLYEIALHYDTTVAAIETLNQITSLTVIHPGDVLIIPLPEE